MAFPSGIGVIDLMIGLPKKNASDHYKFMGDALKDDESKNMRMPAQYMFKDVPQDVGDEADPVKLLISDMDRCGVAMGMLHMGSPDSERALKEHPNRIIPCMEIDPNDIMGSVRKLREAHAKWGIKAATSFPAGYMPQVPVSDRRHYPLYAECINLDIPMIINAGVPGPRVPMACQHVDHFDEVCYDFPDLRIVMRHGAEPWEATAVKLMLKWPGLYYMTSAFAPKYYPKAIIDFANTRGSSKIMYAGYYPMGLSLDRIADEMGSVPFKAETWSKFLRNNAIDVFKLDLPKA